MSIIGSLLNFGAFWLFHPILFIFLLLDGVVYSLVAYSYRLFDIMKILNYSVIFEAFEPIMKRANALIVVFIFYKAGKALITFMVNPDGALKGSGDLVKNILITLALLVSYETVLGLLDEISLLVIGSDNVPADTFKYLPAPDDGEKGGFINRLIFGETSDGNDVNVGMNFSVMVLHTFLHGKEGNDGTPVKSEAEGMMSDIMAEAADGGSVFNLTGIIGLVDNIDRTVVYCWPLLSTIVGIYLIITLVTLCIEVGIRMMKLLFLRIMAPIAIVNMVDGGFSNDKFKKYLSTYMEVFAQIFFRIGMFYMTIAFIMIIYSKLFGDGTINGIMNSDLLYAAGNAAEDPVTTALVFILLLVALFKFLKEAPKLVDSLGIFGFSMDSSSFGKYMKQAAGGLAGGVAGLATGIAGGAGVAGTLWNAASGAAGGAGSAGRGEGVAGQIKNLSNSSNNAVKTRTSGGIVRRARNAVNDSTGTTAIRNQRIAERVKENEGIISANNKAISANEESIRGNEASMQANNDFIGDIGAAEAAAAAEISSSASGYTDIYGRAVEYGGSEDDFVSRMAERDTKVYEANNQKLAELQAKGNNMTSEESMEYTRLQLENSELESNFKNSAAHNEKLREEWRSKRDSADALKGRGTREERAKAVADAKSQNASLKSKNEAIKSDNKRIASENEARSKQSEGYKSGGSPTMATMKQVRNDRKNDRNSGIL